MSSVQPQHPEEEQEAARTAEQGEDRNEVCAESREVISIHVQHGAIASCFFKKI